MPKESLLKIEGSALKWQAEGLKALEEASRKNLGVANDLVLTFSRAFDPNPLVAWLEQYGQLWWDKGIKSFRFCTERETDLARAKSTTFELVPLNHLGLIEPDGIRKKRRKDQAFRERGMDTDSEMNSRYIREGAERQIAPNKRGQYSASKAKGSKRKKITRSKWKAR